MSTEKILELSKEEKQATWDTFTEVVDTSFSEWSARLRVEETMLMAEKCKRLDWSKLTDTTKSSTGQRTFANVVANLQ